MVTAYILIVVAPGKENQVASRLLKMSEVKDLGIVYGEYDIIIKVEVPSMEALQNFVLKIRKDKNIDRTSTMIVASR
ncbi:MAG TPA: Lrp/AsnC family transcriptional regulator [Candidatus Aenigmarchaeota archaeon]|nr:MAG: Lrp/AsnC family transcriptional regulator [Nanoarchaeota archaeon]HDN90958.1 Lrp/AsnC family transcriptional regulator [Candidatus Aenigmarchaeota archaeon]